MRRIAVLPLTASACLLAACGEDMAGDDRGNVPPETSIVAGPVEGLSTSYRVLLTWSGEDPDGVLAGFEYDWDLADEWTFTTEAGSEFTVTADPAPGGRMATPGFHTFRVRAVDDDGLADPTPASRSFNATSVAPTATIVSGPRDGASAAPYVRFELQGQDDDGTVVAYRWTLLTREEYAWDTGRPYTTAGVLAWSDSLTYHPLSGGGGYDTGAPAWTTTPGSEVVFPSLPELDSVGSRALYIFSARAVDDAGVAEPTPSVPGNTRSFAVYASLSGPRMSVTSDELARTWFDGRPTAPVTAFAHPVSFRWDAVSGPSGLPVDAYSWAWGDSSSWSPWGLDRSYPPGGGRVPLTPGPARFFVRARDTYGYTSTAEVALDVYSAPRDCPPQDRTVLVVLDTDVTTMSGLNGIFPPGYDVIERGLVDFWLQDFPFRVHETRRGTVPLDPALLSCAGTVVWIHSSLPADGDGSLLHGFHRNDKNPLPSYQSAGGNLLLCGLQPSQALRYLQPSGPLFASPVLAAYPVPFGSPASGFTPHWIAQGMGVASVETSVASTSHGGGTALRLSAATAQLGGYPDLPFDPLTYPDGPRQRGFGYYDRGLDPIAGAEVLYTFNGDGPSIAVRHPGTPGAGGGAIYLGLHPYFVERPAFRAFVVRALTDLGETPLH